jgi:hypothetical protein
MWVLSRFNDEIFVSLRVDEDAGRLESTSILQTSSGVVGTGISCLYLGAEERSWVSWLETNEES